MTAFERLDAIVESIATIRDLMIDQPTYSDLLPLIERLAIEADEISKEAEVLRH